MKEATATGATHEVVASDVAEFYRHGWHSWCPTGWLDPAQSPQSIADRVDRLGHADPVHALDTNHGGAGVGAVAHGDGQVTLLGGLSGGAWVHLDGNRLVGSYEAGAGEWVELQGPEVEVFDRYADLVADHQGRRGGRPVRLWSSWYSYYEDVSEIVIDATLPGLEGMDFDVVQVDDGWQRAIGDWQPNAKFGSGMSAVAAKIAATGRTPGLWLAPFIAKPESELAGSRPEWVLRDEDGDPVVAGENWGGPYWALDVSRADTIEYLVELFCDLHASGYGFFKLDFIYAAAYPGQRSEPASRSDAYRDACAAIRQAVGDDVYLLACGAPIVESIGVFDGIRIGPDVGASWNDGTYAAASPAMAASVHRLWLRAAIDTDPDVVYFRDTHLSEMTARQLQAVAHIAGFKGTSDPPADLDAAQRQELTSFLSEDPSVSQLSRYLWRVGEVEVDLSPAAAGTTTEPTWASAM